MKVKILVYANKKSYVWRIIADTYTKQVVNYESNNARMRNEIIAAIEAFRNLKDKSNIILVSCRKSFKDLFKIYDKEIKNRDYVKDNFELWNELKYLADQNLSYKYMRHIERDDLKSEMAKLHPQLQK